jgi:ornithine decarboxylase
MGRAQRGDHSWYYLDDGVYGSFSGQIFDQVTYPIEIFSEDDERFKSVLAGPTCDSIDVIAEAIKLPKLEIADLLVAHQMGAYSAATATTFNLFSKTKIIYLKEDKSRQGPKTL